MKRAQMIRPVWLLLAALALLSGGCSSYTIRARVVQSERSSITIEPVAAAPTGGVGMEGVTVRIHRDPSQLNRKVVAEGVTGANGDVVLAVEGFGTGWMAEEWLIEALGPGQGRSEAVLSLPAAPGNDVIFIRMIPGRAPPPGSDLGRDLDYDPMDDYERYR